LPGSDSPIARGGAGRSHTERDKERVLRRINPPIFTGGTTVLTWAPGIYSGSYGTFTVALAPSAPEASTWAMMLAGFGALGFAALRRRVGAIA
jgi:hypothetical protein